MITLFKKCLFPVLMIGCVLGSCPKIGANNTHVVEHEKTCDKYSMTQQELREQIRGELELIEYEKELEESSRRLEWEAYMLRTELGLLDLDSFMAALAFCGVLLLGMGYIAANTANLEHVNQSNTGGYYDIDM